LVPRGRVISFEADPEIAARLRENLARNQFTHAHVEQKAVWSESANVSFARVDPSTSPDRGLGHVSPNGSAPGTITVEAVSLDQYTASHPSPDFLKCDSRRRRKKSRFFRGASQLFAGKAPDSSRGNAQSGKSSRVASKFAGHGYLCQTSTRTTCWPFPR